MKIIIEFDGDKMDKSDVIGYLKEISFDYEFIKSIKVEK
jgi:hypothetical protein